MISCGCPAGGSSAKDPNHSAEFRQGLLGRTAQFIPCPVYPLLGDVPGIFACRRKAMGFFLEILDLLFELVDVGEASVLPAPMVFCDFFFRSASLAVRVSSSAFIF
jgi:hypothetical protein